MTVCAYLSATTKKVMSCGLAGLGPAVQKNFVFAEINDNFIQYSCTIVLVIVPLAVWVCPKLIHFTMNTVDSAQICSLWIKRPNRIFFDFKCWSLEAMCLTVSLQTFSPYPHLPDMTCSVLYNLSQHNVIKRCSFFSYAIMATIIPGPMPKWDLKCCMLRLSCTFCLLAPKPTISS